MDFLLLWLSLNYKVKIIVLWENTGREKNIVYCPLHTSDHFLVPLGSQSAYNFIGTFFITIPQKKKKKEGKMYELAQEDKNQKYGTSLNTEKRFCSFTIYIQIKQTIWRKLLRGFPKMMYMYLSKCYRSTWDMPVTNWDKTDQVKKNTPGEPENSSSQVYKAREWLVSTKKILILTREGTSCWKRSIFVIFNIQAKGFLRIRQDI